MKVVIIDYGAGNVFSVVTSLERLGVKAILSKDAEEIKTADKVIFPGVGQASAAMSQLKNTGLDIIIPQLKMPVLGICLGMQLMCDFTEEENTKGLGIFPIEVKKFAGNYKVPHMGWNTIENLQSPLFKGIAEKEYMYFVHSYYVPENPYSIADTPYNTLFCSAIQKDNFFGCQFHPEKSSSCGELILRNFIEL
ncbi:MAG: imidazole glycerol phosphate synthase subunit HisH [Odoribacter sp.]|nr:imidazole glycerol phosphate synthase subunit HisH [Odoribacter sp.]